MNFITPNTNKEQQPLPARISDWIILYLLPLGCLILLTGLFWVWDRSFYHLFYYVLVVAPTLVALLFQPGQLKKILFNPLILIFILFGSYAILTLFWSDTSHQISSLIRRPFNILVLFFAFGLQTLKSSPRKLFSIFFISANIAVVSGLLGLIYFATTHSGHFSRFIGYGVLYNPLLTSHLYGFFTAFWLALWFTGGYSFSVLSLSSLAILGVVVVSTGSRTPLLALTITLVWLAVSHWNRRSVIGICVALTIVLIVLQFFPQGLTQRGLSYRPEIWLQALEQALDKPWLGYGFDHHRLIELKNLSQTFCDPHNIELAVLLMGGIVGLGLWVTLYSTALLYSWRNRDNQLVVIASSLIIFGLVAGLTEGGAILSRPKEHWFLIWIPIALLSAIWISESNKNKSVKKSD